MDNKDIINELLSEDVSEIPDEIEQVYEAEVDEPPIAQYLKPLFLEQERDAVINSTDPVSAMEVLTVKIIRYMDELKNYANRRHIVVDALIMDLANDLQTNGHLISFDRKLALLDALVRAESHIMKSLSGTLNKSVVTNVNINNNLPPLEKKVESKETIGRKREVFEFLKKAEGVLNAPVHIEEGEVNEIP